MIPKIIHQIWFYDTFNKYIDTTHRFSTKQTIDDKQNCILNSNVPEKYKIYQVEWITKNKDWYYILWNENSIIKFINSNYPLVKNVYMSLSIKNKIKMFKYLCVYHFGGVYIDIHIRCLKSLDKLLILQNKNLVFSEIPYTTNIERDTIDMINGYKNWYKVISDHITISIPFHPLVKLILKRITWGINNGKMNSYNFMNKMVTITINENIHNYKDSVILQNYYLNPCYIYDKKCKHIPLSFTTQSENIYGNNSWNIHEIKTIIIKLISYAYFGYMRNITKTILFLLILYVIKLAYYMTFN